MNQPQLNPIELIDQITNHAQQIGQQVGQIHELSKEQYAQFADDGRGKTETHRAEARLRRIGLTKNIEERCEAIEKLRSQLRNSEADLAAGLAIAKAVRSIKGSL